MRIHIHICIHTYAFQRVKQVSGVIFKFAVRRRELVCKTFLDGKDTSSSGESFFFVHCDAVTSLLLA